MFFDGQLSKLHNIAGQMQQKFVLKLSRSMLPLSGEGNKDYVTNSVNHICDTVITVDDIKVRNLCHTSGIYRGLAHKKCNLTSKIEAQ